MKKYIIAITLTLVSVISVTSQNQEITKKEKQVVLKLISEKLLESYIDLKLAKEISATITSNSKRYRSLTNPAEFSKRLTGNK